MIALFRLAGAGVLAVCLSMLFVLPGTVELAASESTTGAADSVVAVAVDDGSPLARVSVGVEPVDPAGEQPVRVFFSIDAGRAGAEPRDRIFDYAADAPERGGVTIVLPDVLSAALIECADPEVEVVTVPYEELLDVEASAIVDSMAEPEKRGPLDRGRGAATPPWLRAAERDYTLVRLSLLHGEGRTTSFDTDDSISFGSSFNYWSCEFEPEALVSTSRGVATVEFPRLFGLVESRSGDASLELVRTVKVDDDAVFRPLTTTSFTERDAAGHVDGASTESTTRTANPEVNVAGATMRFADELSGEDRDRTILVAGIAAGVVAGLLLSMIKTIAGLLLSAPGHRARD